MPSYSLRRGEANAIDTGFRRDQSGDLRVAEGVAVGGENFLAVRTKTLDRDVDAVLPDRQSRVAARSQSEQKFVGIPARNLPLEFRAPFESRWRFGSAADSDSESGQDVSDG